MVVNLDDQKNMDLYEVFKMITNIKRGDRNAKRKERIKEFRM